MSVLQQTADMPNIKAMPKMHIFLTFAGTRTQCAKASGK